jgi:hypothetical protein
VLITCWSSKGGSGTTVVAAALAILLAADAGGALLVDLGGDLPAALGLPEPAAGVATWARGRSGSADGEGRDAFGGPPGCRALDGLAVDAGGGLRLLPRGPGPLGAGTGPALARALAEQDPVVVDAGVVAHHTVDGDAALDVAATATASLLVIRPCFLALRRAVAAPLRASGVVLVDEPQRVLGAADIEAALGVPVTAVVPWDPAVARRVDAGLLGCSLPRAVARSLRRVARPDGGGAPRPHLERPEAIA